LGKIISAVISKIQSGIIRNSINQFPPWREYYSSEVISLLDPVVLTIGPITIKWYGVIIATAFLLGIGLAYRRAGKQGYDPDHLINMITLIIPMSIIGARLYYVIFEWKAYRHAPLDILALWHGGLAIHGGLLGGVLAGLWYIKRHRLPVWQTADIMAPSIILGQAIGRWGNFFNQEAHGGPVSSSFISHFPVFIQNQMLISGVYYHPTFLYESIWDFTVFGILMYKWKNRNFTGEIALLYLLLYSLARFFIEGLRTDSLMLGHVRVAQLVSALLFAAAAAGYFMARSAAGRKLKRQGANNTRKR
jgi:phosphatidylglycerol:prolipoprotein diacylglycerol transferase